MTSLPWCAAVAATLAMLLAGCGDEVAAKGGEIPEGFDACETALDGGEGPNGFEYLKQVDVGRTEAGGGGDDDDAPSDEGEEQSPFDLDRPYDATAGYGYTGSGGGAEADPSWTAGAWPYGGSGDHRIHLANRWDFDGYRFDVADGVYKVAWHFIEKSEHWSGFRGADLLVEEQLAVEGYDIFEEVGSRFMAEIRALARVEDGHLDLEFVPRGTKEAVTLSALEVEAIDPDTTPPADVTDLVARGGYEQAILTWTPGAERDLRGVNVWRADAADGPWTRVNPRVVWARHFVDHGAESGETYHYKVVAQDLFCNEAAGAVVGPVEILDHDEASLPVFEIELSAIALEGLTKDVSVDLYVPATLHIDGEPYDVEVRNRGASTRYLSKPNFKIRLLGDRTYQGRNGFKLNSEVVDPMLITEKLSYDLFAEAGALAPVARYVHVVLADRYMGVYTEIQEVDKLFFVDHQIDEEGNLYRMGGGLLNILPEPAAYEEIYEKKTNETDPAGHADLIAFTEALNRTPEHLLEAWFDERFAADQYADFLAVNAIVANYDMIDGNQYVYHDAALDQWHHVPWDYNNGTFADPYVPLTTLTLYEAGLYNPWWFSSTTRWMGNAGLRARLLDRIGALIQGELSPEEVSRIVETAIEEAGPDVLLDPWMVAWERDQAYVNDVAPAIEEFVAARYAFFDELLPSLETLHGPLVINEYQALNTGQVQDEQGEPDPWIELFNRGEETVSLLETCLAPDLRNADLAHCFEEPIEVLPGETLLLWADGEPDDGELHLGFVLGENGGELGLFTAGELEGEWGEGEGGRVNDVVFYGPQTAGESYGRLENGGQQWGPIQSPTPGE